MTLDNAMHLEHLGLDPEDCCQSLLAVLGHSDDYPGGYGPVGLDCGRIWELYLSMLPPVKWVPDGELDPDIPF